MQEPMPIEAVRHLRSNSWIVWKTGGHFFLNLTIAVLDNTVGESPTSDLLITSPALYPLH